MKKLKENKTLKYSLFFGFYLIFFVMLFIRLKNDQIIKENDLKEQQELIINVDNPLTNILNSNYVITINDNLNIIKINKEDINSYDYYYFLDIYNVNKLIKKGKLINKNNNMINYEITNLELNNILGSNMEDGINKISINIDNNKVINIILDLSNYFSKEVFTITYEVGDNNE